MYTKCKCVYYIVCVVGLAWHQFLCNEVSVTSLWEYVPCGHVCMSRCLSVGSCEHEVISDPLRSCRCRPKLLEATSIYFFIALPVNIDNSWHQTCSSCWHSWVFGDKVCSTARLLHSKVAVWPLEEPRCSNGKSPVVQVYVFQNCF